MRWHPRVTVAAVIERDNKFLLVEEMIDGELKLNQPAGHWEYGETLLDAVIRETLEETAWDFVPEHLLGIYQWQQPEENDITFLRFAFIGRVTQFYPNNTLDEGIIQGIWLNRDDVLKRRDQHRSPQLIQCIDDYLAGIRMDLSAIKVVDN